MIFFGVTSAIAFALVGAVAWQLSRRWAALPGRGVALLVGALWATSAALTWLLADSVASARVAAVSSASLAWPVAPASPLVKRAVETTTAAAAQAASVESLVGGLEARLAANPSDANGWVLLAQSYAYTANAVAVENAVRRAVELGVDESSLRERVERAQRAGR